jgi:tRNA nucleotidyltransferase (CCA-adding enzyme)
MIQKANQIVETLRKSGFESYFCGGCVRDMFMGIEPQDYDICTNARPEQIAPLFAKTIPVGAQFGVVIVVLAGDEFEVATFRADGRYKDGRRPIDVRFVSREEDVHRRDFTINAMLYDPVDKRVIDYVGGQQDIQDRIIRAVGNPSARFTEDKLRMMRAIRFAGRFDYTIDPETWDAICTSAPEITQVSFERIRDELLKTLTGPSPYKGAELLLKAGILKEILPEVVALIGVEQPAKFHPEGDVWDHTMIMLKEMVNPSAELALAVLLHDVGKPSTFSVRDRIRFNEHDHIGASLATKICRRLRLPGKQVEHISSLVENHMRFMMVKKMRESKLKRFLRMERFEDHLELHRLDCLGSHGNLENWDFCREKLAEFQQEEKILKPPRLISGNDLIAQGYPPGPQFKDILNAVEDAQLEGKVKTKSGALKMIRKKFPLPAQGKKS